MRVELRTRPARQVVADESTHHAASWHLRCTCGHDEAFEEEDAADLAVAAHRPVCPERSGGLVGRATIPPFNVPPSVIFFGERVFVRRPEPATSVEEAAQRLTGEVAEVYVEAEFVYAVTEQLEG